jgi:adenylate cyclase
MASIFLSYARSDAAWARQLARALERAGHDVWWDKRIKGGARYSKEIQFALNRADAVLVLWSSASVESAWV